MSRRLPEPLAVLGEPENDKRAEKHGQWGSPFDCLPAPALRFLEAEALRAVTEGNFHAPSHQVTMKRRSRAGGTKRSALWPRSRARRFSDGSFGRAITRQKLQKSKRGAFRVRFMTESGHGRGCPCPRSRRWRQAKAGCRERSRHREGGCHDGIRERPATGRGHPRPTRRIASARHSTTAKVELSRRPRRPGGWRAPLPRGFRLGLRRCRARRAWNRAPPACRRETRLRRGRPGRNTRGSSLGR